MRRAFVVIETRGAGRLLCHAGARLAERSIGTAVGATRAERWVRTTFRCFARVVVGTVERVIARRAREAARDTRPVTTDRVDLRARTVTYLAEVRQRCAAAGPRRLSGAVEVRAADVEGIACRALGQVGSADRVGPTERRLVAQSGARI